MDRGTVKDSHWHENADHRYAGLERFGRSFLYRLLSFWPGGPAAEGVEFAKIRRLLLIKEPYRMGDLFQITPILRALKAQHPFLRIGLVIQARNLPVFESNPHVDRLHLYEKKKVNGNPLLALSFLREVRAEGYDCAVTLETERVHLTNDLIAWLSGAPIRIRYDSSPWDKGLSNVFYNYRVATDPSFTHQVERNFGVFRPLGLRLENPALEFKIPEPSLNAARGLLKKMGVAADAAFLAVHPGAYKVRNRWPLENYLKLARMMAERGKKTVFTLGPSEREWKDRIEKEGFCVVADQPLAVVAGVLSLSRLILCNDTGILHVSGGLGVKTIALFAETDPSQWKPPGPHVKVLQSKDKNIASIPIEDVLRLVSEEF